MTRLRGDQSVVAKIRGVLGEERLSLEVRLCLVFCADRECDCLAANLALNSIFANHALCLDDFAASAGS